jgi:starch synthase
MITAGIPWSEFTMDKVEFYDQVSFLKAGLTYAEKITTVSPNYAREIQSSGEFGRGMEGTLRARADDLHGILNGLDLEEWNPANDPFLAKPFDADNREGRKDCKAYLQQSLKLPRLPRAPLLGMVARLDPQKGADILAAIVPELMAAGAQIVILGQGDEALRRQLETFEIRYPDAFRLRSDFNEPLAHHIYGGSDLFLMPSRFEPCGLGQLIAMRYGSIPVVMNTGGLADTVAPVNGEAGTGFVFYEASPAALQERLAQAFTLYKEETTWSRLQSRAMHMRFSWDRSAQDYADVYRQALGRGQKSKRSIKIS